MEPFRATLLNPPFAQDPPLKLSVNARTLGLVIAVLAGLGVLVEVVGLLGVLSLGVAYAASGFAGIAFVAIVGLVLDLAAAVLSLTGGWRMSQGQASGKPLVIYGLAIGFAGEIVVGVGYESLGNALVGMVVLFAIYYLVIVSRFPAPGGAPPPGA
ncbi:MAG TPA: hypothetical protein VMW47_12180 [Verrucomicrobiae bacterium]|nr:hypothetical protein [Verrucomicrobiae bacterium]